VWAAHAAQNAGAHQRLQNGFEMARWKLMARRQRLGRNRPAAGVDRHIDDGGNSQNALAGQQRHGWHQSQLMQAVIGYSLASV
jgi:hypothetical protein